MPRKSPEVAKIFVRVVKGGEDYYLFSRKNSPGHKKHNHLELLGGNNEDEDFLEGAIRELKEEETTGLLASKLSRQHLKHEVEIDETVHYIFEISIGYFEYEGLKPNQDESLGFELIPHSVLNSQEFQRSLTKRTRQIFKALGIGV
jgi:NUDIX domain-containing protein